MTEYLDLTNLKDRFPDHFSPDEVARAQTVFLKKLAIAGHRFFGGKMMTVPKAGVYPGWFGAWYTPGVSSVSTAIRDSEAESYELSNRGNLVAVISDSTRVLGDGDVTPPGGLGVMEGKAFLMYYLGGLNATALCVNSYNADGVHDAGKIIDLVKMVVPSFGAVNLEDISQPNCFRVLDELQGVGIPVWHDDAQGTACVTLAGVINALHLTGRAMGTSRFVLYGAGASNTTIARFLIADGADPHRIILFDSRGALHAGREDIEQTKELYAKKWELCCTTNPDRVNTMEDAMRGADVLIALSRPGPGTILPEWIRVMADKSIVFACANPVPEIYPHQARDAGAHIVATGRSDFPNQVNNSLGFPGILKGALLVRARCVTDRMAIAAAHSLAGFARRKGISPEYIIPLMEEEEVFIEVAASVAAAAIADGVAQHPLPEEEVKAIARRDTQANRRLIHLLMTEGIIPQPPADLMSRVLDDTVAQVVSERG